MGALILKKMDTITKIINNKIQPQYKSAGWLAGALAGAGSLIGGIAGGLFGKSAQSDANATNLKIAQMNNEFNERMLEKQIAYNRHPLPQRVARD